EVSISPLFRWPNSVNHFKVGIEAVAQGDVCDGGTGFRTLLNDLSLERFAVGTALRAHGKSA
ncbi:hypothetical protein, partial [Klebsiella pneumoniae]